ncbi:hypothetical protein [Streptomyces sp. NPDC048606]|uniref:hypothetical protein n=1 Tax=Streptomyces sp. NPDC048606 TaxID=3154726 RepID=UPI00341741E1
MGGRELLVVRRLLVRRMRFLLVVLRFLLVVRVLVLLRWRRMRRELTLMGVSGPA